MKGDTRGRHPRIQVALNRVRRLAKQAELVMIPELEDSEQEELCQARLKLHRLAILLENHPKESRLENYEEAE